MTDKDKEAGRSQDASWDAHAFQERLGLAQLALRLLDRFPESGEGAHGETGAGEEEHLMQSLKRAKAMLQLAGEVEEFPEVEVYRVFEAGAGAEAFMSYKEIASHLKEGCCWPGLNTLYLVETTVEQILSKLHEEIQEYRRRIDLAARQRSGALVDVAETEANVRRALNGLLIGTPIHELLGADTGGILSSGIDRVMERVHEVLQTNDELMQRPPPALDDFFNRLCDAATYENYLGANHKSDAIDSTLFRGVLEELNERYVEGRWPDRQDDKELVELQKIGRWLKNLKPITIESGSELAKLLDALEKSKCGEGEEPDLEALSGGRFASALNELAIQWTTIKYNEWLATQATNHLADGIAKLREAYDQFERPDGDDEDGLDRFREFPHCADATLAWLNGDPVRPRIFFQQHPVPRITSTSEGRAPLTLEMMVKRRFAEFESCLDEFDYCLDGDFVPYEKGVPVREQLVEFKGLLEEQRRSVTSPSRAAREAARARASELLDGLCSTKFNPGNIHPYLLFRYAAERGITAVGKKRDQKLVADGSKLKRGCLVSPPRVLSRSDRAPADGR